MVASSTPLVRALVAGVSPTRRVLYSPVGLSFWGGVEATTGRVVDARHPLFGESVRDRILALPSAVGSCTGSQTLLELTLNGAAPAAIVARHRDEILSLGSIVADEFFDLKLPVLAVEDDDEFEQLSRATEARTTGADLVVDGRKIRGEEPSPVALSARDRTILAGREGQATRRALGVVARLATAMGAKELGDVSRAHIDACVYVGPASLRFAETLVALGGRFVVPTTTNAASVDLRRWRDLGVPRELGEPAERLAQAYVALGAKPTFTCAPYLLDEPRSGEHLGWSESNAVAFANSWLGARSAKTADYLDACVALTGRAPLTGPYVDRRPVVVVSVEAPSAGDDAFWPLAGYCVGRVAGARVPLVIGLEGLPEASIDDRKNFAAAFATTAAATLFHILGHTPEAASFASLEFDEIITLRRADLENALAAEGDDPAVDLVAIGSPHASLEELARLEDLCRGKAKNPQVRVVVTLARSILEAAECRGLLDNLRAFGVDFVADTCWCMLADPVVPIRARILTNSAKYAHYAPGLVRPASARFAGLAACVDAAVRGRHN